MNHLATTKDDILKVSSKIILEEGIEKLSMRHIASKLKISVGTVYNYYESKDVLIHETVNYIWNIILEPISKYQGNSLIEYLDLLYDTISKGNGMYPGFLSMHSVYFIGIKKNQAMQSMSDTLISLRTKVISLMNQDQKIRKEAFNGISIERLSEYIFSILLKSLNSNQSKNEYISFVKNYFYSY